MAGAPFLFSETMDRTAEKKALRQQMLARLKNAAANDPQGERSAALRRRLAPLLAGTTPLTVAIYAPLPHEVDLLPLLQEHPQHRYAFPRCLKGHCMEFRVVRYPQTDLTAGAMGILAPAENCPLVLPQEIDLLVVPGVAFTLAGTRLGYGGGYYDRYIPLCSRARILACAFAEQLVDNLPTEPHDYTLPLLIHL